MTRKPAADRLGFVGWTGRHPCRWLLFLLCPLLSQAQVFYTADTTWFKNPERGISDFVTSHRTSADSTGQGFWRLIVNEPDSITLAFEEFVLHDFRASPISPDYLNMMRAEFANVRKFGMKAIVIFCYITSYDWKVPSPPDTIGTTIDWMLTHIGQLQPVIRENSDVIAFFQAGFIGRWGEWAGGPGTVGVAYPDYSLDTTAQGRLLTALLAMVPTARMVDVRAPRYKFWYLHDLTPMTLADWLSGSPKGRIGEHNNAFHVNATNSGTFYDYNAHDTSFFRPWYKTETKFGGSVVELSSGQWNDLFDPRWFTDQEGWYASFVRPVGRENAEMANQHVASLPRGDDPWTLGMQARGLWDIVRRKAGYRFQLLSAEFPLGVTPAAQLHLRLRLTNTGWASLRNPRGLELILRDDSTGMDFRFPLFRPKHPSLDPRLWWPGDTVQIDTTLALSMLPQPGTYRAFLNLPDTSTSLAGRPAYSIRLANRDVWEARTGYNSLGVILALNGTAEAVRIVPTLPWKFSLEQNYPNPFNPSTTIVYTLPSNASVRLTVYDMLGRELAVLIDRQEAPGRYELRFDGSALASGIYLYRLQAGPRVAVRLMVLTK